MSVVWATVVSTDPLRIRLDGDTVAVPYAPASLVDPLLLVVGGRVRCTWLDGQLVVDGMSGGAGHVVRATKAELDLVAGGAGWSGYVVAESRSYVWDDGEWVLAPLEASQVVAGTFASARIPNLSASKITSGTVDRARLPFEIAAGNVTITPGGSGPPYSDSANITFPAGRFSALPNITTGIRSGAETAKQAGTSNASTSGFTITFVRDNTVSTTVDWVAVNAD